MKKRWFLIFIGIISAIFLHYKNDTMVERTVSEGLTYHNNGKIETHQVMVNNKMVSQKRFDENGKEIPWD